MAKEDETENREWGERTKYRLETLHIEYRGLVTTRTSLVQCCSWLDPSPAVLAENVTYELRAAARKRLDQAVRIGMEATARGHRVRLVEDNFPLIERVYAGASLAKATAPKAEV